MLYPDNIWAAAGLLLILLAAILQYRRLKHVQRHYRLAVSLLSLAFVRQIFYLFAAGLIVLALVGPRLDVPQPSKPDPLQILFLMDASQSMQVTDVGKTRMVAAKELVAAVSDSLKGHLLSLVGFADFAYTYVPFTKDDKAFRLHLDDMESDQFSGGHTNIRYGLNAAVIRFYNMDTTSTDKYGKVLVILTDGDTREPIFENNIQFLQRYNIKVLPVTVGTKVGGKIPLADKNGFYKEKDGSLAISRAKGVKLDSIANRFGTMHLRLNEPEVKDLAHQLIKEISKTIRHHPEGEVKTENAFHYPVAGAAFLLLFATFLKPIKK